VIGNWENYHLFIFCLLPTQQLTTDNQQPTTDHQQLTTNN